MKKYRLLKSKTIEKYGRTLYKIKSLRSFGGVKKGDEGGYVEKEENLSHEGSCWVGKEGVVFGDGIVTSGGEVSGGVVWGGVVSGGEVWGGEVRGGEVWGGVVSGGVFSKTALQIQGSRHFVNISRPNHIRIGCHEYSFDHWKENFKEIGRTQGYSKEEIAEYGQYIEMAINFPNQPKES